jgi:TusE/DsrC/DsvC family sulfur relay protein
MYVAEAHPARDQAPAVFAFDQNGFLIDPEGWSPDLARELAEAMGIAPLTDQHWETIRFIRRKYLGLGALPPMRSLCRRLGLHPGQVKQLFGGCRQLWSVAGLPDPGEEAKTYMV